MRWSAPAWMDAAGSPEEIEVVLPRLRGRPIIVGVGVGLAVSYEAKAFGIRTELRVPRGSPKAIQRSAR